MTIIEKSVIFQQLAKKKIGKNCTFSKFLSYGQRKHMSKKFAMGAGFLDKKVVAFGLIEG